MENTIYGTAEEEFAVENVDSDYSENDDDNDDDDDDNGNIDYMCFPDLMPKPFQVDEDDEAPVDIKPGGKRGMQQGFKCHNCEEQTDSEPLYCPHPDTKIGDENAWKLPDMEYPFCSYACMKSWAMYEIGGPIGAVLCRLVEWRAGGVVTAAPPYVELLVMGMGGLAVRDDFIRLDDDEVLLNANPEHAEASGRRVAGKSSRIQKQ